MDSLILEKLKELKPVLEQDFGITQIALFGSYARGEETETSDIDLLIMSMNRKNGITIVKAQNYLSSYFQKKIDIGLFDSLGTFVKNSIKNELIYV